MMKLEDPAPMGAGSVSIAMCTYNAEKFLLPQLDSFLRQTQLPSELVIQDDNSSDRTLELIEGFSKRASFPVRVKQNPVRLGPTGNFEQSMGRCGGDVVVFSDADDIWYPERIEAAATVFARRPEIGCVFSDADLVNEDASPRGMTLWQSIEFTASDQDDFEAGKFTDALFRRTIGFGGTMAVRGAAIKAALPIPRPWGHDNWTALISVGLFGATLLRRPLIMYRQHGTQYSGGTGRSVWKKAREASKRPAPRDWVPRGSSFDELASRLKEIRPRSSDPERTDLLLADAIAKGEHQRMREQLPANLGARLQPVLKDAFRLRYRRYSNGLLSALRDLAVGRY